MLDAQRDLDDLRASLDSKTGRSAPAPRSRSTSTRSTTNRGHRAPPFRAWLGEIRDQRPDQARAERRTHPRHVLSTVHQEGQLLGEQQLGICTGSNSSAKVLSAGHILTRHDGSFLARLAVKRVILRADSDVVWHPVHDNA
jgi:hypothetical protein